MPQHKRALGLEINFGSCYMNLVKIFLPFITALCCIGGLVGCASPSAIEIGMTEKAWRRSARDPQLAGSTPDGERVWQSEGAYYHFRDGKLTRINRETQRVEITLGE